MLWKPAGETGAIPQAIHRLPSGEPPEIVPKRKRVDEAWATSSTRCGQAVETAHQRSCSPPAGAAQVAIQDFIRAAKSPRFTPSQPHSKPPPGSGWRPGGEVQETCAAGGVGQG